VVVTYGGVKIHGRWLEGQFLTINNNTAVFA